MAKRKLIGVTNGMAGWFAVLYDDEPIETGIGRYETRAEAEDEGRSWAQADGYYTDFDQSFNLQLASERARRGPVGHGA